jgi:hypothetical protein
MNTNANNDIDNNNQFPGVQSVFQNPKVNQFPALYAIIKGQYRVHKQHLLDHTLNQ